MSVENDLNSTIIQNPDLFGFKTSLNVASDLFSNFVQGIGGMVAVPSIPSLTGGSAGPAVSGGGSPQHNIKTGTNPLIVLGAILFVGVIAFKAGRKK